MSSSSSKWKCSSSPSQLCRSQPVPPCTRNLKKAPMRPSSKSRGISLTCSSRSPRSKDQCQRRMLVRKQPQTLWFQARLVQVQLLKATNSRLQTLDGTTGSSLIRVSALRRSGWTAKLSTSSIVIEKTFSQAKPFLSHKHQTLQSRTLRPVHQYEAQMHRRLAANLSAKASCKLHLAALPSRSTQDRRRRPSKRDPRTQTTGTVISASN